MREIVAHKFLAANGIAAAAVQFSEGIVDRRVDRTRRYQDAQLGYGQRQLQFARDFHRCLEILGLQGVIDIQRMGVRRVTAREAGDLFRQRLHRAERHIVIDARGREAPHVAHGHGRAALRRFAAARTQAAAHVQHGDAIHLFAAEFVRRAIEVVLKADGEFVDARVGGWRCGEDCRHGQERAPPHRPAFASMPRTRSRSFFIAARTSSFGMVSVRVPLLAPPSGYS